MKTLLLSMALAGFLLPLAGCETYPDTPAENRVRVAHSVEADLHGVAGDAEGILLIDHPLWLTRYPMPND